jgi:hypothetical protein
VSKLDTGSVVLTGFSGYIDVVALLIAAIGLPLFAGTKRETILDRDNIVGLLLVGLALLLHGGFGTLLRSSPHGTFNGYVLGWDGGDDERRLWIYDLGYPPKEFWIDAPSRSLHLEWTKNNPVPADISTINGSYLKVDYRLWDLEIASIDALPVSRSQAGELSPWHWKSHATARLWPMVQTILGVLFVTIAGTLFVRTIGFKPQLL